MAVSQHIASESDIQRIDAAPLALRLAALLIDGLVLLVPVALISGSMSGDALSGGIPSLMGSALLVPIKALPAVLLLALLEGVTDGRTIGKMLMGIRVIGVENGEPIGLLRALGRRGFMLLESYVMFIPSLILIPFNRNFDGHLGDRLTGAIVARNQDIARAFRDE